MRAGLSQRDLADRAGVSRAVISRIGRGIGRHYLSTYARLARVLDLEGVLEERLASSREETLYLREPPDRHALIQLEKLDSRVEEHEGSLLDLQRVGPPGAAGRLGTLELRVQELEEKFRDLRARAEGDSVRLESTTARVASTSRDVHAYLAALTLGVDPGEVPVWCAADPRLRRPLRP